MSTPGCEPFASDCHVRAATDLISHTWDPVVLSALRAGPTRRVDLLMRIGDVSDRVLAETLTRLQSSGLVRRAEGSPRGAAVYELTALGRSFAEGPLDTLATWAMAHTDDLAASPGTVSATV